MNILAFSTLIFISTIFVTFAKKSRNTKLWKIVQHPFAAEVFSKNFRFMLFPLYSLLLQTSDEHKKRALIIREPALNVLYSIGRAELYHGRALLLHSLVQPTL